MTREESRFCYVEGKIWALDHILHKVVKRLDMQGPEVRDALLEEVLNGYPAARDPKGPIGKGVREIFRHVFREQAIAIKSSTQFPKNDSEHLDPVCRRLLSLATDSRTNLRAASLVIGRNADYLHQFIHRGNPQVLAEDDREALAERLGCSPEGLQCRSGDQRPCVGGSGGLE